MKRLIFIASVLVLSGCGSSQGGTLTTTTSEIKPAVADDHIRLVPTKRFSKDNSFDKGLFYCNGTVGVYIGEAPSPITVLKDDPNCAAK